LLEKESLPSKIWDNWIWHTGSVSHPITTWHNGRSSWTSMKELMHSDITWCRSILDIRKKFPKTRYSCTSLIGYTWMARLMETKSRTVTSK
jgi:hypothetical protein